MGRPRDRMYYEWLVLPVSQDARERCTSVLQKFPCAAGRDVVTAVVHSLAANLGISGSNCEPSTLVSDVEVNWCMEVICFGLQLSLSEHEAIRDCVHVYCEWLQALTQPKPCVPKPVQRDANQYVRRMLRHLYNLFVPREDGQNSDTIGRQAVLCHRVLRRLQEVAQESTTIEKETWDEILLFLLAISDTLLAPPSGKDDIGSHLCERILTVLFEVWLLACQRCFPSPNLWKTLRELCCTWRHRTALVVQWNRINLLLTSRMLRLMYGHHYPIVKMEDELQVLPVGMSQENVAQAWYRFLHVLGDPVDLCRPEVISQTPGFYSLLERNDTIVDPFQNPCLAVLPVIFHRAMAGIATLVDAFLGISHTLAEDEHQKSSSSSPHSTSVSSVSSTPSTAPTTTPPHQRKGANRITAIPNFKGMTKPGVFANIRSGGSTSSSATHSQPQQPSPASTPTTPSPLPPFLRSTPSLLRPRCNSVLHLYGSWLFESVLVGSDLDAHSVNLSSTAPSDGCDSTHSRTSSLLESTGSGPRSGGGGGSLPGMPDSIEIPPCLNAESFEAGQAEAAGALCRLFCSKRTGEEILPVYFARFYLSLRHVLMNIETKSQVVASILLNSCDLFRQDMEGVNMLLPLFFHALECVFSPDKESKIRSVPNISQVDLRYAATHHLLSMLALPLHYGNLEFKDFGTGESVTFRSLRPRLMSLLIGALQNESDSTNTQMLLGGLLFCIQDATAYEEATQVTQPSAQENCLPNMTYPNLLCSDSASALFVRAIYLVCHRLISSWMTDMHVSLAALEVLSGLAKVHRNRQEALECRRAVKWICDFIVFQCQRPPPAHSRDLHSTIVAAFQCLTAWLVEHPLLLQDNECVNCVLEVVELGISGSKSQPKISDTPLMKAEKELKPSSLRVGDAAEALLSCMMDHVGYFPNRAGPEALSSLLNEETLLKYSNVELKSSTPESIGKHFRYFIAQKSAIVAILEQNLGNDQGALPTVTLLVRVPFGRHAWTMQLRHLPRHKSEARSIISNPGRPYPCYDQEVHNHSPPSYFPETVEDIPVCKIDKSIPDLSSTALTKEQAQMLGFIDQQSKMEKSVCRQWDDAMRSQEFPNPETDCKAPSICQEIQTARLFLSHFGFLWDDFGTNHTNGCPLMALDNSQEGYYSALEALDNIPSRTNDTMFVFYVRDGQTSASDILSNVTSSKNVHPQFLEFLRSLGWPVDVGMHTGWTGNPATSWKVTSGDFNIADLPSDHGGSLYSGHNQVLYWSDVMSELVVIVPSPKDIPKEDNAEAMPRPKAESCSGRPMSSMEESTQETNLEKSRAMSFNYDLADAPPANRPPRSRQTRALTSVLSDLKVLVVWLESFEDHITFPLGDLLLATNIGHDLSSSSHSTRDLFIIFIHALQSGLFRIKVQGRGSKTSQALPLVDGMVVSRRVLGVLVRQTALSMCRRRRLEAEMCPPPHARRRTKIQDIGKKFRLQQTQPQLHETLFQNSF